MATAQTGVEMEALVAVTAAALTVYDMCKALDKGMEITDICLVTKTGGKSGDFHRDASRVQPTREAAGPKRPRAAERLRDERGSSQRQERHALAGR